MSDLRVDYHRIQRLASEQRKHPGLNCINWFCLFYFQYLSTTFFLFLLPYTVPWNTGELEGRSFILDMYARDVEWISEIGIAFAIFRLDNSSYVMNYRNFVTYSAMASIVLRHHFRFKYEYLTEFKLLRIKHFFFSRWHVARQFQIDCTRYRDRSKKRSIFACIFDHSGIDWQQSKRTRNNQSFLTPRLPKRLWSNTYRLIPS